MIYVSTVLQDDAFKLSLEAGGTWVISEQATDAEEGRLNHIW